MFSFIPPPPNPIIILFFVSFSLILINRKRDWPASGWPKPLQEPRSCRKNGPSSRVSWLKSPDWVWTAITAPAVAMINIGYARRIFSNCNIITCYAASKKPRSVFFFHPPFLFAISKERETAHEPMYTVLHRGGIRALSWIIDSPTPHHPTR